MKNKLMSLLLCAFMVACVNNANTKKQIDISNIVNLKGDTCTLDPNAYTSFEGENYCFTLFKYCEEGVMACQKMKMEILDKKTLKKTILTTGGDYNLKRSLTFVGYKFSDPKDGKIYIIITQSDPYTFQIWEKNGTKNLVNEEVKEIPNNNNGF